MRNKKIVLLVVVTMLLILSLSLVFSACDFDKNKPGDDNIGGEDNITPGPGDNTGSDDGDWDDEDDTPPPPPPPPVKPDGGGAVIIKPMDVLKQMAAAVEKTSGDEKKLNFDMSSTILTDDGKKYEFSIKTNLSGYFKEDAELGKPELAMVLKDITDTNTDNQPVNFAFYIIDEKPYIQVEGYDHLLYLSDFNMRYVLQILKNAPEVLIPELDKLLGGLGFTVDSILNLVVSMLCSNAKNVKDGNVTNLSVDVEIKSFIKTVTNAVAGLQLPISLNLKPLLNTINDLVPNVKIALAAKLVDGALAQGEESFSVKLIDKDIPANTQSGNEGSNSASLKVNEKFSFTASMKLTEKDVNIELPVVTEEDTREFSFTNMGFDIDFILNTADGAGSPKQVDIGALVNTFLKLDPNNKTLLPEKMLMLTVDMGFRLSFKIDLDLDYKNSPVDKNLIAIELFLINKDHQKIESKPQLGLYYQDGAAYAQLGNLIPNYYQGKNIRLDTNLKPLISMLVDKVATEIDKALKTDFDSAINPKGATTAPALASADIFMIDKNGEATIIPWYVKLLDAVAATFGIQEYLKTDHLTDANAYLELEVSNDLLAALEKSLGITIRDKFSFPDNIGDIRLFIGNTVVPDKDTPAYDKYNENGTKQFGITGETSVGGINVGLQIRNFGLFFQDINFKEYVTNAIGDKKNATNSIRAVLDDVLANFHFQTNLSINFTKGTYDIIPFLLGVGGDALSMLEGQHLLWTFDEDFTLDADLIVQIALDKNNSADSTLVVELKTNKEIRIGSEVLFPANTVILGLYGYNNAVYADLSNIKIAKITLPKLKADLDFTALVNKLLGDFDYKLAFDLTTLFPKKDDANNGTANTAVDKEQAQQYAVDQMFVNGDSQGELTAVGQIIVGVDTNKLAVTTTLAAILDLVNYINKTNGKEDKVSVDFIKKMDINLVASRLDGLTIDIDAELVPKVTLDSKGKPEVNEKGETIYTYDSKLKVHLETGTSAKPLQIGNLGKLKIDLSKKADEFKAYEDDLIQAIVNTIGKAKFQAKVNLKTLEETFNLTSIINNILSANGKELNLPINLHLDDWNTYVDLTVAWKLDLNNFNNSELQVKLSYLEKTLLEVDIYKGSIVIDLSGLGFFSLELTNAPFLELINNALKGVVDKLGSFNLSEILNKALGNLTLGGVTGNDKILESYADSLLSENPPAGDNQSKPGLDQATLDLIAVIINGVRANNATLFVKLDALMLDQVLTQLLGFGLGIGIGVDAKFDVVNGEIDLGLKVESMSVDINLKMMVGEEPNINVDLSLIPDWDCTNGETLAKALFDNLDIALALDYKLTNKDIYRFNQRDSGTAQVEDNDDANQAATYYTRVIVEKLKTNKTLANTGGKKASKGSILVSLGSINKTKYNNSPTLDGNNFSPMLYAELNYNEGKLNVALAKNLLKLGTLIDFADLINISVPLDIIKTLAPTFQGLLDQIKDLNKNFGKPNAPQENSPVPLSDPGTTPTEPKPKTRMDLAFENFDIMQLLSGGIDVYLRNTGLFNANVTFDPFTINWLIDEIMSSVFGPDTILNLAELAPDLFATNYLAEVNWDRIAPEHFWFSLQDIIKPLAKEVVRKIQNGKYAAAAPFITDTILNGLYGQVRRIVGRLVPFPVFNEFSAGINVMDGSFANVYIQGYDRNETVYLPKGKTTYLWNPNTKAYTPRQVGENENVVYTYWQKTGRGSGHSPDVLGNNEEYTREYVPRDAAQNDKGRTSTYGSVGRARGTAYCTEIWLYNCSPSVGSPDYSIDGSTEGVMTWGEIDAAPKFDPYMYGSTKNDKGEYQTTDEAKSAFLAKEFSNKEVKYQRGAQLLKTTPTYSCVAKLDSTGKQIATYAGGKALDAINFNEPGIYKIIATANFTGSGVVRTYDIYLTVYGFDKIAAIGQEDLNRDFVDEVQLHAYSKLPSILVIKYDKADVRGEYKRRIPVTDNMFMDYAPEGIHDHVLGYKTVDGQLVADEGGTRRPAKLALPGCEPIAFKLHYLDSTVEDVKGGKYVSIDLYQFTATKPEELAQYAPETLYFQYPNGASDKVRVNAAWDMTEAKALVEKTDLSGAVYTISNTIGSSTTLQDVNIYFVVKSRVVSNIEVNGQSNIIKISPYQYYLYNVSGLLDENGNRLVDDTGAPIEKDKDESLNPFPTTVQATYTATVDKNGNPYLDEKGNPIKGLDRYTEDVLVKSWNINKKLDWNNDNKIDLENGVPVKNTTLTLDTVKTYLDDKGVEHKVYDTKFSWDYELNVSLNRNQVQEIYFDEELKVRTFSIDPYQYKIYGDKIFPRQAWVKFTNGEVMKMPIGWVREEIDTFDSTFGFEVQNRQFRAYIGYDVNSYPNGILTQADVNEPTGLLANADYAKVNSVNGRFLQRIVVNAKVEGLVAEGIEMKGSALNPGTVYVVDPIISKYGIQDKDGNDIPVFPAEVTVRYKNGAGTALLPVDWTYDAAAVTNINGVEHIVATATIRNTDISFDINCRVLDRSNPIVTDKTRTINPYEFTTDKNGNRVYKAFTSDIKAKYFKSYTLRVTKVATATEAEEVFDITDLLTDEALQAKIAELTTGENKDKYTTETIKVYDTYETMKVEYFTSYTLKVTKVVKEGEEKEEFEVTDLFTDDMLQAEIAKWTTGDNKDKYTVATTEVRDTYDIPVVWNTRAINYIAPLTQNKDVTINAYATFKGGDKAVETITVPCTILYKKVMAINEDEDYTFYIVKGGKNLSDIERNTHIVEKDMYVTFTNGTKKPGDEPGTEIWDPAGLESVKTKVTFDFTKIDFTNENYDLEKDVLIFAPYTATAYIMKGTDLEQTINIKVYVTTAPTESTDSSVGE